MMLTATCTRPMLTRKQMRQIALLGNQENVTALINNPVYGRRRAKCVGKITFL